MCDTLDMNTHLPKPVKEEKEPEKVEQKEEEKKEEEKEKVPFLSFEFKTSIMYAHTHSRGLRMAKQ